MSRTLALAFFLCLTAITGFAQSRLDGKWLTERPAGPLTITDTQRKQSAQLEVTIEETKASGTLSLGGLGGTFYTFKDGKVTGNKVQFQTDPPRPTEPTWTIEMVDDNTVILYRGSLPVVGSNLLDLTSVLGGPDQPAPPVQVTPVVDPPVSLNSTSAQGGSNASIGGIVQDPSKALVPGVMVTARNVDTGAKLTTTTNGAGRYAFPSVIPGKYTMTASLPGFKTTTVSDLSIGDTQFLQDLTLELTALASANPSATSCSRNGLVWCALLHRAK